MKTLMMILLLATFAFAQPQFAIEHSHYISVTLTNTDTSMVYVLFPSEGGTWYLNETKPTSANYRNKAWTSGDVELWIETVTTSGSTDSMSAFIKPLGWNPRTTTFEIADKDSTHLVFGTVDTYTATSSDYLDWDTGEEYHCLLTSELWPTHGFVLFLWQKADGGGVATFHLWMYNSKSRY